METKIIGTVMPVLELSMQPGDKVFAESGQLSWMSMAIQMMTSTSAGGQQGGFMGALGRVVAGGTLFMTEYSAGGGPGLLAFAAKLPGQILPMEIAPGHGYLVHRHGFMCATPGVQFSIGFQQRLGAGVFGGTGFRMQRLQGQGQAWVELHGEVVTYDLQPGNTLRRRRHLSGVPHRSGPRLAAVDDDAAPGARDPGVFAEGGVIGGR
jgi:uncharacterized protein (AIM24 family)